MFKPVRIAPSILSADFMRLGDEIAMIERGGAGFVHVDVMDGHFVPNLMLCNEIVKSLRSLTNIPFDFHFMVDDPLKMIRWYQIQEGDVVSIHYEVLSNDFNEIEEYIHSLGAKLFIAIKPETKVDVLKPLLNKIDGVLVMTVVPGFAGSKLVPETLDKIKESRMLFDSLGYKDYIVEVDGNVSYPNSTIMRSKGADMFVAGTSSVFKKELSIKDGVNNLKNAIKQGE